MFVSDWDKNYNLFSVSAALITQTMNKSLIISIITREEKILKLPHCSIFPCKLEKHHFK